LHELDAGAHLHPRGFANLSADSCTVLTREADPNSPHTSLFYCVSAPSVPVLSVSTWR